MYGNPELLTAFERCPRIAHWAKSWIKNRLTPYDMLRIGVTAGLTDPSTGEHGMVAGEELYALGATRQIESKEHDIHAQVVHLASIADIVVSSIRKPIDAAWRKQEPLSGWNIDCFLSPDGGYLRRLEFTTSWSQDKHYSMCRAWDSLGPICHYGLPMQLIVVMLGRHLGGRFHSYWSHGLTHPVNKKIRFRKKTDRENPFKSSWVEAWREDHDEIDTATWLNAMIADDVIRDVLFRIDIAVPEKPARQNLIDLAARKLDKIDKMKALPDRNLSSCDWPSPCQFRRVCDNNEDPGPRYGFVPVESLNLSQ